MLSRYSFFYAPIVQKSALKVKNFAKFMKNVATRSLNLT